VWQGRAVESLQNFETVKYFASDKHELRQFSGMVKVSALSTPEP
jgi:ABC-type transport system involved in Fe-S cluster assembly fused permease/ATPase subunit